MSQARESFVARQPILNKRHRIVGYELLFRDAAEKSSVEISGADQATASVIVDTFSTLGVEVLLGATTGFINVSEELLMGDLVEALPRDRVVLELPRLEAVSPQLEARCRELHRAGFRICLQDVERRDPRERLYAHASYAKFDHREVNPTQLKQLVRKLSRASLQVVAERVEAPEDVAVCRDAGCDLFQGYYFARPVTLTGRRVDPEQSMLMELLLKLGQDCDFDEIAEVFKRNAGLGVNLLRLVNSGALARSQKVKSVPDALVLIGRNQLSRWLTLLLYANDDGTGMESALLKTAAKRGRCLELLCAELDPGQAQASDVAYLAGMLSLMDVLFGVPMDEVLTQVGAGSELTDLLIHRKGPLGVLLGAQERLEASDFDGAEGLAEQAGIPAEAFFRADGEAFAWVQGNQTPSFDL